MTSIEQSNLFQANNKNPKFSLIGFDSKPSDVPSLNLGDKSFLKNKPPHKTRIEITNSFLKTTKNECSRKTERGLSLFKTFHEQITRSKVSTSKELASRLKPKLGKTNFERTSQSRREASKLASGRNPNSSRHSKDRPETKKEIFLFKLLQRKSKSPTPCRSSYDLPESLRSGSRTHVTACTNRSSDYSAATKEMKIEETQYKIWSDIKDKKVCDNKPRNPPNKHLKQSMHLPQNTLPFPNVHVSGEDFSEYSNNMFAPMTNKNDSSHNKSFFSTLKDLRESQVNVSSQVGSQKHKKSNQSSVSWV